MTGWISHLVLGSTGLALTVLATALVLRAWRRLPVPSYRLAVAVLAAALALPAAQLAARSLGLPFEHPVRMLVDALRGEPGSPTVVAQVTPTVVAPRAAPRPETADVAPQTLRIDPALLALALLGQDADEAARPTTPARSAGGSSGARTQGLPWRSILAWAYVLGLVAALGRTARRLLRTRSLLRSARPVRDPRVHEIWSEVSQGSPLAGRVRLLESTDVRAPSCFGLGRPAVVLPADGDLARRRDVLGCVLTHELVHLERRDGWVLLGEELLRAVFWFHPAAWWLVARLERLREVSCDLLVVRRTGQRKRYAQALVEYAAWMTAGERILGGRAGRAAAVVPWSESKGQLTRRIEMLLSNQAPSGGRGRYVAPAAVGLVFTFLWSGQLALAAGTRQEAGSAPHTQAVHALHNGEHAVGTTTIEAQGGVVVTTRGKQGQAVLHADKLELEPGQAIMVARDGGRLELVGGSTITSQGDAPIGIVVGEADDTLAAHLGQDKQRVVVVRSVVPDSRAAKAGLQEHDVIVSVDGKGGKKQDLIDHAKQALREGRDVDVVVIRKGDRKPFVLRAGEGRSAAVWVQKEGGESGESQTFDLSLPKEQQYRMQVESDEGGRWRVFGLGQDHDEDEGGDEEAIELHGFDGAVGIGGGAGGSSRGAKAKAWLDEDGKVTVFGLGQGGQVHVETHVETAPEGEHEVWTHVFGLGQDGEVRELRSFPGQGAKVQGGKVEPDGDGRVEVFGLGQGGGVLRRGQGGKQVIELQLDSDDFGKALRKQAGDYYRQVDPEDFQAELRKALKSYEASREHLSKEDAQKLQKLQVYAQKDAKEALEQARKALEGLSDRELGRRTARALEQSDAYSIYSDELKNRYKIQEAEEGYWEVPRTRVEALKDELEATRQQLEAQRRQIEELKRSLEKLARERNRELR